MKKQVSGVGMIIGMLFYFFIVVPIGIVGLFFFIVPGVLVLIFGLVAAGMLASLFSTTPKYLSPDGYWRWNGQQWIPNK